MNSSPATDRFRRPFPHADEILSNETFYETVTLSVVRLVVDRS